VAVNTIDLLEKLQALRDRPGTAGEGQAAQAAIDRILAREAAEALDLMVERWPPGAHWPDSGPLQMDDLVICTEGAGTFKPCR
jgi:hypothetical protein